MSESWDAEVFRVPDISWQTLAPPTRHPIPVGYVTDLEVGDEVTIGVPGRYFLDGQLVARAERGRTTVAGAEHEALAVAAPFAYWLAQGFPREGLTMQWWPVEHSWVYRDAAASVEPAAQGAVTGEPPESWLHHVRSTLDGPPVRHPWPARTADAVTGRMLRMQHQRGAWSWWVAVSEPIDADGDFMVHVMHPSDYWLAQAAGALAAKVQVVPLHRLFTYG